MNKAASCRTIETSASRRNPLVDLVVVLVRPLHTLAAARTAADVAKLVVALFAIDFILSVLLIPAYADSIAQQLAAQDQLDGQSQVAALGMGVVVGSIANIAILAVMAGLFLLAQLILVGRASFRDIMGILMVASAPAILDRVIRVVAFALGWVASPTESPLSFAALGLARAGTGWGRVFGLFSPFDVLTFLLVTIGFHVVSKMRWQASVIVSGILWGGLQALLARLQLDGFL